MSNKAIELLDKWDEMTEPYLQVEPSIALEHADLMGQELRRLHAEVDGMRKDAARYRYIRDTFKAIDWRIEKPISETHSMITHHCAFGGKHFESTIDAAMQN